MKIYTAGKLYHADMLKALEEQWSQHVFTARWASDHVGKVPDTPAFAREFWIQDHADVANSDIVLVYADEDDKLRGSLIEAGIAIALGVSVVVIGDHQDFGTWTYHPCVSRVANLEEAAMLINLMSVLPRDKEQYL